MPKGVYERKSYMGNYGLTAEKRKGIRQDRMVMSLSEVAAKYGISRATVSHICRGNWGTSRHRMKRHIMSCTACRVDATGWIPCERAFQSLLKMSIMDTIAMFTYVGGIKAGR